MVFMLIEQIRTDLNVATKARDSVRQRTLRSIIAAVQEAQVSGDTAKELDDDGVMAVLKAQVKRRIDAAEAFDAGNAADRAAAERSEQEIIEGYLPAAMTGRHGSGHEGNQRRGCRARRWSPRRRPGQVTPRVTSPHARSPETS